MLSGVGDQNGDGKADLGLTVGTGDGRLLILYGRLRQDLAVRRDLLKDSDFDVVFPVSPGFNDRVHVTHSSLVDMDEDSWPDLLVMDSHYLDAAPPSRAMCIFGGDLESKAAPLAAVEECYQIVNYNGDNPSPSSYLTFPQSFHALGDVNGDGHEDLLAVNSYGMLHICYNPLSWIKFGRAFIRGDANQDGALDIADAITILQYLFARGRVLPCMDAGDANDDETVNIADAIRVLSFLFGSGVKPPLPPPSECGPDPQGDTLDCRDSLCE
jgi:hypothetical protein